MLFIVEKRGVAFSASFWYLGGAYVQYVCVYIYIYAVQSKMIHMYHYLDKYISVFIYIYIYIFVYQVTNKLLETS